MQNTQQSSILAKICADKIQHIAEKKSITAIGEIMQMAKDAGVDVIKMEKEELSKTTESTLIAHTQLAEQLKIPGVPTMLGLKKDGKFVIIPPMDIDGFNKTLDSLKLDSPSSDQIDEPVQKN